MRGLQVKLLRSGTTYATSMPGDCRGLPLLHGILGHHPQGAGLAPAAKPKVPKAEAASKRRALSCAVATLQVSRGGCVTRGSREPRVIDHSKWELILALGREMLCARV